MEERTRRWGAGDEAADVVEECNCAAIYAGRRPDAFRANDGESLGHDANLALSETRRRCDATRSCQLLFIIVGVT